MFSSTAPWQKVSRHYQTTKHSASTGEESSAFPHRSIEPRHQEQYHRQLLAKMEGNHQHGSYGTHPPYRTMNQNTPPMPGGQIPPNRTPQQPPQDDNGDYGDTRYHAPPPVPGEAGGHFQFGSNSLHSSLHPQDMYTAQAPRHASPSQGVANLYSASRSFPLQDPVARPTHGANPHGNLPAHPHSGSALAPATGRDPFLDPTYATQLLHGNGSYTLGTAYGNSSFADLPTSYSSETTPAISHSVNPRAAVFPHGNTLAHGATDRWVIAATRNVRPSQGPYLTHLRDQNLSAPTGNNTFLGHSQTSFPHSQNSHGQISHPGSPWGQQSSTQSTQGQNPHGQISHGQMSHRQMSHQGGPSGQQFPNQNMYDQSLHGQMPRHPLGEQFSTQNIHSQDAHRQMSHLGSPSGQQFYPQNTDGQNPQRQMSHQGSAMGQHFSTQNMSGQNRYEQSSMGQAPRVQSGYGHVTGQHTHLSPSHGLPLHGQGPSGQNSQYRNPYFANPGAQGTTPAAQSLAQDLAAQSQYHGNPIAPAPPQTSVQYSAPQNPFSGRPTVRMIQEARALPGAQQSISAGQHPTPKRKRATTPIIPASAPQRRAPGPTPLRQAHCPESQSPDEATAPKRSRRQGAAALQNASPTPSANRALRAVNQRPGTTSRAAVRESNQDPLGEVNQMGENGPAFRPSKQEPEGNPPAPGQPHISPGDDNSGSRPGGRYSLRPRHSIPYFSLPDLREDLEIYDEPANSEAPPSSFLPSLPQSSPGPDGTINPRAVDSSQPPEISPKPPISPDL